MNLNELDLNNIGSWPLAARLVLVLVVFAALVGVGAYMDWTAQWEALEKEQKQEETLKSEFTAKLRKAVNLEAYKQQLADMEEEFGAMLRQLPSKAEIEALIEDFSQTGLASGLEFELFKRGSEQLQISMANWPYASGWSAPTMSLAASSVASRRCPESSHCTMLPLPRPVVVRPAMARMHSGS